MSSGSEYVYYNPNDTYSPSWEILYAAKLSPTEFSPTNEDYYVKIGITVVAVFIAGLVSWLIFTFGLSCRCCCNCCRCLPRKPDPSVSRFDASTGEETRKVPLTYPWTRSRICLTVLTLLVACAGLAIEQVTLSARWKITNGVYEANDAAINLNNIVFSLQNQSNSLVYVGEELQDVINLTVEQCKALKADQSDIDSLQADIQQFIDGSSSLGNNLNPVHVGIDSFQAKTNLYAQGSFFFILWAIGSVCFILLPMFALGGCMPSQYGDHPTFSNTKCRSGLHIVIAVSSFVYLVMIVFGILWMLISAILGGLCISPTHNIIVNLTLPKNSATTAIIQYYTTCQGSTTIQDGFNSAYSALQSAESVLADIDTSGICNGVDAELKIAQSIVRTLFLSMREVFRLVSCESIQPIWFQLVNTSVCSDITRGIFLTWGSQIVSAAMLLILMILSSIVYQYHLPYDQMLPPKVTEEEIAGTLTAYDGGFLLDARDSTVSVGNTTPSVPVEHQSSANSAEPSSRSNHTSYTSVNTGTSSQRRRNFGGFEVLRRQVGDDSDSDDDNMA